MTTIETSLPGLTQLIEERLAVLRTLAESLECSSLALVQNDAQAIVRGAAHQAELCRQWSHLEDELHCQASRRSGPLADKISASSGAKHSAQLQTEWEALSARIRYLTRVHSSLLRHLLRSLAILSRVVDSCAYTYAPDPGLIRSDGRPRVGE